MMNAERLLARVFDVPYAVTDANRPVLTMWRMVSSHGQDPLDIDEFRIKAALAYDELIRMLRNGRADHLFVGIPEPAGAELVQGYFSAPARGLGVSVWSMASPRLSTTCARMASKTTRDGNSHGAG